MKFKTRTLALAVSLAAAVGLAGLIYWWDPAPPPPAEGLIHQHAPHMQRQNPGPATPIAAPLLPAKMGHEPMPIPAASTATPPAEAWLPRSLTAEEKTHRAAADAALMKSELLHAGEDANVLMIQKEVINQRYDDVDTQLNGILAKAIADQAYDLVERDASEFAEGGISTPQLNNEAIDDWLAARPNSPWAHLSAGRRLLDQAWEVRGGNFANKVSDEQWKAVHRYAAKARAEAKKSLKLNPQSAMAWLLLIQIDQVDSGPTTSDYRAALQHRPASILVPDVYQGTLQPRWGGSYEQMHAAAHDLLSNLKKNPRFWSIGGFAAADEGYGHMDDNCDPCSPPDWTSMLKNYNAALAYGDHTGWLAEAGKAALHLHRYALAYHYYERANAYRPEVPGWQDQMKILRMICDPQFPRQELESYEQEAVTYGMIDAVEHPRVSGDCKYYQAELPWGDEPIPTADSIEPYYLEPDANPPLRVGPSVVSFTVKPSSLKSQDGRYIIVNGNLTAPDANGNRYKLQLQDTATGVSKDFYAYATSVSVSWTVNAKRLFVSDDTKNGDTNACSVLNIDDVGKPIVVFQELANKVKGFSSLIADKDNHLFFRCFFWATNDHLLIQVNGWHTDTKLPQIQQDYEFDLTTDSFKDWNPGSH